MDTHYTSYFCHPTCTVSVCLTYWNRSKCFFLLNSLWKKIELKIQMWQKKNLSNCLCSMYTSIITQSSELNEQRRVLCGPFQPLVFPLGLHTYIWLMEAVIVILSTCTIHVFSKLKTIKLIFLFTVNILVEFLISQRWGRKCCNNVTLFINETKCDLK